MYSCKMADCSWSQIVHGYSNSFFGADSSTPRQAKGSSAFSIAEVRLKNISVSIVNEGKEKEISFLIHSLHANINADDSLQASCYE